MITALLTFVFVWSLFYGSISPYALVPFSLAPALLLAVLGRHEHGHGTGTDVLAQKGKLRNVSPALKFWTLFTLMLVSVASRSVLPGLFLTLAAGFFAVIVSGLPLDEYLGVLTLPLSFMLVGGVALLFEMRAEPTGVMNIPFFSFYLSVSETAQATAMLVVIRALGALSCLCLLSVSTTMSEIIAVLRRAHCPILITDLCYLIYRYIFILQNLHREMYDAARSRLGFRTLKDSLRATGNIYANLLARSYTFALKNFDAMESRCYDSGISFLERRRKVTGAQAFVSVCMFVVTAVLAVLPIGGL